MRLSRQTAAAALLVLAAGCAGSHRPAPAPATRLPVPFVRAPAGLERLCLAVARAVGYAVPCPARVPRGLAPAGLPAVPCRFAVVGLPCRTPAGRSWNGWVVGSSWAGDEPQQHLVIVAGPRPIRDYAKLVNGPAWYPTASVEVGGTARVAGRRARWVYVPPATNDGSAFAGHLVLAWTAGGHSYAVGFHETSTRRMARAMDLALRIRLVRP